MKNASGREMSNEEVELLAEIRTKADDVCNLINKLQSAQNDDRSTAKPDPRWTAIGKTHLQQGFMALNRAVTRPELF